MQTKRRFAHELYPHADEWEVRPLSVEVPYRYARAIGLEVSGTGWFEMRGDPLRNTVSGDRTMALIAARETALLADALHQALTGADAWAWAQERMDESGEWIYERAVRHGVPVKLIKPYRCGPEPGHHDHKASTGDVMGSGVVTRVKGKESECPTCCEASSGDES